MYFESNLKSDCCGCRACEEICPKDAIELKEDSPAGHYYPEIDNNKCIKCHLCEKVCPLNKTELYATNNAKSYIGIGSDNDIFKSASGGAFANIAFVCIQNGYYVYGVKFDNNLKVVHEKACTIEEIQAFRKSKYIQSNTNNCFKLIENDLKSNNKVLFSGVPCQCAALNNYLKIKNIDKTNLITISLLCHGVPSQYLFDVYLEELQNSKGKKVKNILFRNKIPYRGVVNSRTAKLVYDDDTYDIVGINNDAFLRMYYKRLGYRPSCADCHFACKERTSDITLADAWKIESIKPELNPLRGVSLIITCTDKANRILDLLNKEILIEEIPSDWALNSQGLFSHPTKIHVKNKQFLDMLQEKGFKESVMSATKTSKVLKFKLLISHLLRMLKS